MNLRQPLIFAAGRVAASASAAEAVFRVVPGTYRRVGALAACGAGLVALAACGGSTPPPKTPEGERIEIRVATPLARRACKGDGDASVDIGGNGKAAVRHVKSGGKPVCAELDLNLDGRVDLMRKFGPDGQIELEQHDLDFDGRLDQEAFFENGALVRKELDTNFDRWIDTWVFCDGAFIARLERDRHRIGRVDTWEEYERGQLVRVRYDDDGDGKIERWELYRNGKLAEVVFDPNTDGVPDRRQTDMPDTGSGVEPVSCNGFPLPPPQAEAPPPPPKMTTPTTEPPATEAATSGTTAPQGGQTP